MSDNNNNQDCTNCKQSVLVGEISKRLDKAENETNKINDKIATIREDNVSAREIANAKNEDMKEFKSIVKGIYEILDKFKTDFVDIKQEMIYNKQFRVESALKFTKIEDKVNLLETDIDTLKLTPAKDALRSKVNFKRQGISFAIGACLTVLTGVILHVVFLLF